MLFTAILLMVETEYSCITYTLHLYIANPLGRKDSNRL